MFKENNRETFVFFFCCLIVRCYKINLGWIYEEPSLLVDTLRTRPQIVPWLARIDMFILWNMPTTLWQQTICAIIYDVRGKHRWPKHFKKERTIKITCRHWKIQDFLDELRVRNISHGSHQADFLFVQIGFSEQFHHGVQRAGIAMFKDGAIHRWPQIRWDRRLALTVCIKSLIRFSHNVCFAIFAQASNYKSSQESVKMTLDNATEVNITQWSLL